MAKRILVIDDEEGVRDAFELALEPTGYEVETASTGEEGLAKARHRRPDMIFLDLHMPGMDGVEVLRQLHCDCGGARVYIVTAFYSQFLARLRQAAAEGIPFELAKKPLSSEEIVAIAKSVLEGPIQEPATPGQGTAG